MSGVARLREIVVRLRAPGGCPWDREQTHESLRAALIEECYEVIEAIGQADDANLREELGDLLLHVVMHTEMASERGAFNFQEVADEVCEKLIRRHPHVFGDGKADNPGEVLRQWERIKREEKGAEASVMDGLLAAMPALLRAQRAQNKAARVGFDWPSPEGVFTKLTEEIGELQRARDSRDTTAIEEEMGDLLFTVVNLARHYHVDAETALSSATAEFVRRFRVMESFCTQSGRRIEEHTPEELDAAWVAAKAAESKKPCP